MLKGLVSIFLNFPCSLCQRPASKIVCSYCEQQIKSCQLRNIQKLPVFVWGKYDRNLQRAIALMKYDGLPEMGLMLGEWLGESWANARLNINKSDIIIVPIPLHRAKLKQRGFNQAEKIAEGFCSITGYNLQPKVLTRIKQSEAMFNLNPAQRKININNAFAVEKSLKSKLKQKSVLLIDDIYTTGSTVKEATKVLHRNNIKVMGVAVVATPSN